MIFAIRDDAIDAEVQDLAHPILLVQRPEDNFARNRVPGIAGPATVASTDGHQSASGLMISIAARPIPITCKLYLAAAAAQSSWFRMNGLIVVDPVDGKRRCREPIVLRRLVDPDNHSHPEC